MQTTRRDFLARAMLTVASGSALAACGGYGDDTGYGSGPEAQPAGDDACSEVGIAGNHGHSLVVSLDDVSAGEERSYAIRGGSPHDHTVVVTQAHFAALADGDEVVIESSNGAGHTHMVTVRCV